jgi:predicted nucleotidyltransferase
MPSQLHTIPPWLDRKTTALVEDKVRLLVERHPDILAIILYGSLARHEERSLEEPDPSDVDLLAVFDTDDPHIILHQRRALFQTMELAEIQHLDAPREVNVMFSTRSSREWDPDFIEHVKRDGILLYQRGKLPAHFAA